MPVRLLTLSMLDLHNRHSFWDIGFCTGSVSVEAKLQFPHLHITAFEVREEGRELLEKNSRKFGTPGITGVIGVLRKPIYRFIRFLMLFLSVDTVENLPYPDDISRHYACRRYCRF